MMLPTTKFFIWGNRPLSWGYATFTFLDLGGQSMKKVEKHCTRPWLLTLKNESLLDLISGRVLPSFCSRKGRVVIVLITTWSLLKADFFSFFLSFFSCVYLKMILFFFKRYNAIIQQNSNCKKSKKSEKS
jgi:hypothetical protein